MVGRCLRLLGETASTNACLAEAAALGAPEGAVIHAESQTAGRGRQGRRWVSPRGKGLCLSALFRPQMEPAAAATFPLMAGCAIAEALQPWLGGEKAMLKWPNDVMACGRKLCGVLCEMKTRDDGKAIDHIVAGVGINVNLLPSDLDAATAPVATSLAIATGATFGREEILAAVLLSIEDAYFIWRREGLAPFLGRIAWRDALAGRVVRVDRGKGPAAEGVADGISPDGSLRLRLPGGGVERVFSGDAHVVLP